MALSDDLRERVWGRWWKAGCRARGGQAFRVSIASAVQWVARFKAGGNLAGADAGIVALAHVAHRDYLLGLIRRQPDMTLLKSRSG